MTAGRGVEEPPSLSLLTGPQRPHHGNAEAAGRLRVAARADDLGSTDLIRRPTGKGRGKTRPRLVAALAPAQAPADSRHVDDLEESQKSNFPLDHARGLPLQTQDAAVLQP